MFTGILRDFVQAARSLANARTFTFVCVVSLGIGMAPVIAVSYGMRIFTTPPPGVDTEGLVEIVTTPVGPRRASNAWSYPDFIDLRGADTGVSLIGWVHRQGQVTLDAAGAKIPAATMYVSHDYFRTIGVALARGPGFQATTEPVVILGHAFWQNRLNADDDVIGKTLDLDGTPHVVVGVAPEPFEGHLALQGRELFVPLERHPVLMADDDARFDRSNEWVHLHGRLSPGVGVEQASAAVAAAAAQLARQYPSTNELRAGAVEPYHPMGIDRTEFRIIRAVWLTMAGMVLLVVSLNVSGMFQVRSAIRERELSIRQAIGATRGRLVQHLLAEAVVLAALGATLASLVLFNLPPLLSWWMGEPIPPHFREALGIDLSIVAICVGLCLVTSLVFGWLPAARFSRPLIITVLKDETGGGGVRAGRVHRVTAALQVAIAVPLLVMSGMSLDRVRTTATAALGFDADLLYAAPLKLDAVTDLNVENAGFRIRRVRDNLAGASGVTSVTIADGLPLDFRYRMARVSLPAPRSEDRGLQGGADAVPTVVRVHVTRVGDGYLGTMGIRLFGGRGFTAEDGPGTELVTIISQALADRLFPGADGGGALGRRVTFELPDTDGPSRTLTIVGVTADFPTSQMSTEREQLLLPLAQHSNVVRDSVPVNDDRSGLPKLMVVARSAPGEPPLQLTAALENAIRELDPDFEPSSIVTGVSLRRFSMDDFLTQSAVAGISGGVILLLAALGIYGVVALMVATRTREIAVRVTLGASRLRVIGMILFDVVKLVAPGVAVGLLIAAALVRLDGGILGVPLSGLEPLAYVAGATVATVIAVLASLGPARRAASVQPMVAMRSA